MAPQESQICGRNSNFTKRKKKSAELCQILCMVTYYNFIHIMNIRVTIFSIAFEVMLLVSRSIFLKLNALTKFQNNTINGAGR